MEVDPEEILENSIANNSREEELIWASESLRVSDDEEDSEKVTINHNKDSEITKEDDTGIKKRVSRIIDSESEEEVHSGSENKASSKKVSRIVDSESEEEVEKPPTQNKKVSNIIDSESEEEEKEPQQSTKKGKSRIIDSDSEEDVTSKKPSKIVDSESEEEEKKPKKFSSLVDSESEPEPSQSPKKKVKKLKKKKDKKEDPGSGQSDGSSSGSDSGSSSEDNGEEEEGAPIVPREKTVQRASAKRALDEISAIKSETQRLLREQQVSIPYHKPKQHSLKEFMSRRNITKPEDKLKTNNSTPNVKMSQEELEAFAKKLDDRAKEAEEFFKPEEESKENEEKEEDSKEVEEESNKNEYSNKEESTKTEESKKALDIDNLKKLLNIPKLSDSPRLSGSSDMLIDLESGDIVPKKPTGVDKLFQRFLKSNGKFNSPKSPMETTVKVLSAENGKLEMTSLNVSISKDNTPKNKEPKPYEAYFKLKENLKTLIQKKRQEDFSKKVEDSIVEEKERRMLCGDEEEDDDNEDDDEIARIKRENKNKKEVYVNEDEEIEELMEDDDEDVQEDGDLEVGDEQEVDEKDEDEQENDDDENEDDESSEEEEEEEEDVNEDTIKKNRIIKAFEDSDEEGDLIKTQKLTQIPVKSPKKVEGLFTPDDNHSDVENELLEICSGQFLDTQKDQIPMTQGKATEDELMELCSGTFVTQVEPLEPKEKLEIISVQVLNPPDILSSNQEEILNPSPEKKKTVTRIVSSDEEEETTDNSKKLKKKKKKRVKKLGFSDDEDDSEEELIEEEEEEEDLPETYIDYDSEENEVEVTLNKKEVAKEANKFVDNEAELSESEWGSADEDEKDMDKYDIELGDEEKFDQDQLQKELGKIHMRDMLDADARNIKKLTEMFFEDEENDGVGRQRQFRWKNAASGFSLDDPTGVPDERKVDDGEEESEEQWRKLRFEREQARKAMEGDETFNADTTIKISKKINIITVNKTANEYKENSPFLISKARSAMSTTRGSFLVRGNDVLERLAVLTEGSAPVTNSDGTAGSVQMKATRGKGNFVFKHLNEEEHQLIQKRKAEAAAGPENNNNVKKQKLMKQQQKVCLIDQLL
ncbi:CLSPN family protein [Megaselia abdita]